MKYYKLLDSADYEFFEDHPVIITDVDTTDETVAISHATYAGELVARSHELIWMGCGGWWVDPRDLKEIPVK